ncbi:MAG TPA: BadF/BadG/BcrA/BcrD ATPase family protein, partial [Candidatus Eremiobacteraceae bacterium]|nr:BadF/BadG/BcrA/BcrD ATPase family protein [Candidatus Eremiobacteraceae bacterium]
VAITVRNDAAATLGLVGPERPAMVVIADTGSIAYGEGADGEVTRAGGHGAVLGDCASAVSLGLAVLRHTADVLDECETRGPLARAAIERLKLERATDIVARIRHPDFDEPLVESLAAMLDPGMLASDPKAQAIVDAESAALARNARRVARAIRSRSPMRLPVLLVGCVFAWTPVIRDRVCAAVKDTGDVTIVESGECVHGAARVALDLLRVPPHD